MGIGQNTFWVVIKIDTSRYPAIIQAVLLPNDARQAIKFTTSDAARAYVDKQEKQWEVYFAPLEIKG